jgi:alkylation response protein AidB-like acyl-CoA dehydrogenase
VFAAVDRREDAHELLQAAQEFAAQEIAPLVQAYDEGEYLPLDLLERMAELGFFGGVVSQEWGGLGLDYVTFTQLIEEISKVCHVIGTLVSMPSGLVGAGIERFGTDAQKGEWLKPLAGGRIFGAAAVTEPGSGSDVAAMQTTYRRDGADFVINGSKAWISNLEICSFVLAFATKDRTLGRSGVSAFIIPADTPGLELRPYKNKLGFRPLSTGDVFLNDVHVGHDALLGEEGDGFRVAMTAVERGRLGVAARSVGVTQACLDDALAYAKERRAFNRAIGEFQIVQSKLTDMVVGATTSRLLVRECAQALQRGERARELTSIAKMHASDVAFRSASDAMQIFGAYGVSPEYRIGRFFRDAKILQIVEGSNDLHRALIAEMALGYRN